MVMPLKGGWFNCKKCEKQIYRSLSDQKKCVSKNFFCSKFCRRCASPQKFARQKAYKALKKGFLIKPKICQGCRLKKTLEGHHHDYSKPLDIEWLCRSCHDIKSRDVRIALVESRRKIFEPCACGRKAVAKNLCKSCYMKKRIIQGNCRVPNCNRYPHTRGLCNQHRQNEEFYIFALPHKKRGPQKI